ncbi:ABC transporter substrate-binding protein [Methanospirillum sp.]|uniref:ABC transporter substrate-binding protein n=1 Tax=Methanospirillum sp. TaxID=45200 RepID=UPI00359F622A
MNWKSIIVNLVLVTTVLLTTTGTGVIADGNRTITDMAGTDVVLPEQVDRVITVGSVAVINAILITMGKQDTIVSGIPPFFSSGRFIYLRQFAPDTINKTRVEEASGAGLNVETAISLNSDVLFTFDKKQAETLREKGLNMFYLSWWTNAPDDMKNLMSKLGEVYNIPERAETYNSYLDSRIEKITDRVVSVPENEKPKVLVCNFNSMKSYESADWWIQKAGGINVAHDDFTSKNFEFDIEKLVAWDPDYIFVYDPSNKDAIYNDGRFGILNAVKNKHVDIIPSGIGPWLATSEQPLALMWAAKKIYPEKFEDIDIPSEMKYFYETFCNYEIPDSEISYILGGGVN